MKNLVVNKNTQLTVQNFGVRVNGTFAPYNSENLTVKRLLQSKKVKRDIKNLFNHPTDETKKVVKIFA